MPTPEPATEWRVWVVPKEGEPYYDNDSWPTKADAKELAELLHGDGLCTLSATPVKVRITPVEDDPT